VSPADTTVFFKPTFMIWLPSLTLLFLFLSGKPLPQEGWVPLSEVQACPREFEDQKRRSHQDGHLLCTAQHPLESQRSGRAEARHEQQRFQLYSKSKCSQIFGLFLVFINSFLIASV
jgi:hypothetical protein